MSPGFWVLVVGGGARSGGAVVAVEGEGLAGVMGVGLGDEGVPGAVVVADVDGGEAAAARFRREVLRGKAAI